MQADGSYVQLRPTSRAPKRRARRHARHADEARPRARTRPAIATVPRPRFNISSAIRIETGSGALANPRWMALLASVDGVRVPITAAAKAAGLSYKAAWDAIDAMNNLARQARRRDGGRRQGRRWREALGATRQNLLDTYRMSRQRKRAVSRGSNSTLKHADRDLRVLGRLSMRTSARNQWSGKVAKIRRGAVNDEVEIKLAGGDRIVAMITHESVENLGLEVGRRGDCAGEGVVGHRGHRRRHAPEPVGAQSTGRAKSRRVKGAVNTEVVIDLRGGNSVAAIITNVAAKDLKLDEGHSRRWRSSRRRR